MVMVVGVRTAMDNSGHYIDCYIVICRRRAGGDYGRLIIDANYHPDKMNNECYLKRV